MVFLLAQITTSDRPIFFLLCAVIVAAVGCGAAVLALRGVKKDQQALGIARTSLVSSEAWQGGYCQTEQELNSWLYQRQVDPKSGVGGIIRACWAAWWGGRAASTSEIHAFVGRRERNKIAPKLSGGIAALLLVVGIVGTLMSVHPILSDFQFRISSAVGENQETDNAPIVNVADSTERVNALMNNLARAFYPSLAALFGTIAVVFFRGLYSHGLHQYIHDLDDFVTGALLPAYRPRSISDEYSAVRESFTLLAKAITEREEKFDKAISQLTKFVDSVGPTLNGLDNGIDKMATAADALASKSNSIATTLTRTLGKKSPLYEAVNGFEGIFAATNQRLEQLSNHIEGIRTEQQEHRKAMLETLKEISGVINQVSGDHQRDRENTLKAVAELEALVAKLPAHLLDSARKSFDEGIAAMRTKLGEALDVQAKETSETHQHIRSKTEETLDLISTTLNVTTSAINHSLKALPEAVDRLNESLKEKSVIETAAVQAIDSVAKGAKDGIRSISEEATRSLSQPPMLDARSTSVPSLEPFRPRNFDQPEPTIHLPRVARDSSLEPTSLPVFDRSEPRIPATGIPSDPIVAPTRTPEFDQPEPFVPTLSVASDPIVEPSSPLEFDRPQAHPSAFSEAAGTPPQPSARVESETNPAESKSGRLGWLRLFGGRKS